MRQLGYIRKIAIILERITVTTTDPDSVKYAGQRLRSKPPGTYDLYICNHKRSRSKKQRGYYFGCMVHLLCEVTGYNKAQCNEVLKLEFNPELVQLPSGRWLTIGKSIENESPKRVEQIYEQIRAWASETYGLEIPAPGELTDAQMLALETE